MFIAGVYLVEPETKNEHAEVCAMFVYLFTFARIEMKEKTVERCTIARLHDASFFESH